MIDVYDLTLTYPSGKGVFNLDFSVGKGEVMGYLGPNGAGKTTTIRALMGFMKPEKGNCSINGLDCFAEAPKIQKSLGYIPGEIAFLDGMNGEEFIRLMQQMRGDFSRKLQDNGNNFRVKELMEMFELDPKGKIKKFSKGMKQKLGIVVAFMHDPQVLILDEPTSGLDPLMQNRFVELIQKEKARGKTIIMSSHSFEEVEKTCDNILIIKDGKIINKSDAGSLKSRQLRKYFVKIKKDKNLLIGILQQSDFNFSESGRDTLEVSVPGDKIDSFVKVLANVEINDLDIRHQSLEDLFMQFYGKTDQSEISSNLNNDPDTDISKNSKGGKSK